VGAPVTALTETGRRLLAALAAAGGRADGRVLFPGRLGALDPSGGLRHSMHGLARRGLVRRVPGAWELTEAGCRELEGGRR
jgi:hypothetical protein